MPASHRRRLAYAGFAVAIGLADVTQAAGATVAIDLPTLKAASGLQVSIAGATRGGPVPLGYTADGRNTSPLLAWSGGPAGTRSYVVLMQDPDAPSREPATHWAVWNIPADVAGLPKAMRNVASPTTPLGCAQGENFHGSVGYSGPRPPPGEPPHHYHVQVFALDRPLRVRPGSQTPPLLAAMSGHVLAAGEEVLSFVAPTPKAAKPAKPPAA